MEKCKSEAFKDGIQLLYNNGLFDLFESKDPIFNGYLSFTNQSLLEKYGSETNTSDGVYYLSDLDYSTRNTVLNSLKIDQYKDIVEYKYRIKQTTTERSFIHFENYFGKI